MELKEYMLYDCIAEFNQKNKIPYEVRIELAKVIEKHIIYALQKRQKEESKIGKKINRFFRDLFGGCTECKPKYEVY